MIIELMGRSAFQAGYRWKVFSERNGVTEPSGIVDQVGDFFVASPIDCNVIGEPMVVDPVQALFNTLQDAASVLTGG